MIKCPECEKTFKTQESRDQHCQDKHNYASEEDSTPDWTTPCENCGEVPIVPCTGMCGPCTFGEADTMGGNW